mgnify:CR=1 FL=1
MHLNNAIRFAHKASAGAAVLQVQFQRFIYFRIRYPDTLFGPKKKKNILNVNFLKKRHKNTFIQKKTHKKKKKKAEKGLFRSFLIFSEKKLDFSIFLLILHQIERF